MRFERDEEAGITLRVNAIVQAVFILVALGLCVKFMLEASPRVLLAAVLVGCVIFMLIRMLRFIHLYGLWKNAYFEMGTTGSAAMVRTGSSAMAVPSTSRQGM